MSASRGLVFRGNAVWDRMAWTGGARLGKAVKAGIVPARQGRLGVAGQRSRGRDRAGCERRVQARESRVARQSRPGWARQGALAWQSRTGTVPRGGQVRLWQGSRGLLAQG